MMDIFGGGAPAMPQAQPQPAAGGLGDIFGAPMSAPAMQAPTPQVNTTNMFQDSSLSIDCSVVRGGQPGEYIIKAYFSNSQMMSPLSDVNL